jgi:hypothetical protein
MAKIKRPRSRKVPKADSVDFTEDQITKDIMVRCRWCNQTTPVNEAWLHSCPRNATGRKLDGSED